MKTGPSGVLESHSSAALEKDFDNLIFPCGTWLCSIVDSPTSRSTPHAGGHGVGIGCVGVGVVDKRAKANVDKVSSIHEFRR